MTNTPERVESSPAASAAVEAVHRAICEDSLAECVEWEGLCVQAVEAATPHIIRQRLGAAK